MRAKPVAESRAGLEAEHDVLVARLHQRSDDFDASSRLKLVMAALQGLPYPPPIVGPSGAAKRKH